jgi:hypothetical protein
MGSGGGVLLMCLAVPGSGTLGLPSMLLGICFPVEGGRMLVHIERGVLV